MAINLNQNTDCCETSCDNTTVNTPGPQGPQGPQGLAGSNGSNGTNGKNGYSITENTYIVPSTGGSNAINVFVEAGTAEWVQSSNVSNQIVYLTNIGHFVVRGKGTGGSSDYINLEFLDYGGDPASPGDTIPTGTVIAPAGRIGPASTEALLTARGQLLTATNSGQTTITAPPDNERVLKSDSSISTGLKWGQVACSELTGNIDLASQISGDLPLSVIEQGGADHGSLMYYNGSSWAYLAAGAAGTILKSNGSGNNPQFVDVSGLNIPTVAAMVKIAISGATTATLQPDTNVNVTSATYNRAGKSLTIAFGTAISANAVVQITSGSLDTSGNVINCKWELKDQNTTSIDLENTLASPGGLDSGVVHVTVFE